MKSPFRRRRKRLKGRLAAVKPRSAEPVKPAEHEPVDWPADGTGRTSMMGSIRGDGETGAGFGAGMFEDLHAAFSGSKKIQLEEQEAQKLRRGDDHHVEGEPRDNLDSGKIRIKRSGPGGADDQVGSQDGRPEGRSGQE